jgi:hypothetical protein
LEVTTMIGPKAETAPSVRFRWIVLVVCLLITPVSPLVHAQSAPPEVRAQKSGSRAKKPSPGVAGQTSKPTGAKAKPRTAGTAKAAEAVGESAAVQSSPESDDKAPATPAARRSETVDFDTDADDRHKMEPGLEMIQAAPRRARHRSLVPATPSPEDSVVNR